MQLWNPACRRTRSKHFPADKNCPPGGVLIVVACMLDSLDIGPLRGLCSNNKRCRPKIIEAPCCMAVSQMIKVSTSTAIVGTGRNGCHCQPLFTRRVFLGKLGLREWTTQRDFFQVVIVCSLETLWLVQSLKPSLIKKTHEKPFRVQKCYTNTSMWWTFGIKWRRHQILASLIFTCICLPLVEPISL